MFKSLYTVSDAAKALKAKFFVNETDLSIYKEVSLVGSSLTFPEYSLIKSDYSYSL